MSKKETNDYQDAQGIMALCGKFAKVLKAGTLGLLIVLMPSCSTEDRCKSQLDSMLGLKDSLGWRQRDNAYRESVKPEMIQSLDIYIENSLSMDGYVNGDTQFKGTLGSIIFTLKNELLADNGKYTLNYINDSIIYWGEDINRYVMHCNKAEFAKRGLDNKLRGTSDIAKCLSSVMGLIKRKENKGEDNVSVFVSDCVFSPKSGDSIQVYLDIQRGSTSSAVRKLGLDYGVIVYRFLSDFNGTFYDKADLGHTIREKRPYFVWIIGKRHHLADIRKQLVKEEKQGDVFESFSSFDYIPYFCRQAHCKISNGKHVEECPKLVNGRLRLDFLVDYSDFPLSEEYLTNGENYNVSGSITMHIKNIAKTDKKPNEYTHMITLESDSLSGDLKADCQVTVSLKRKVIPRQWTEVYDDANGDDDYRNGTHYEKPRTFGLRSLIEGTYEAYKDIPLTKMSIIIN